MADEDQDGRHHSQSWKLPGLAIAGATTALAAIVGGVHLFNIAVAALLALAFSL